MSYVPLSIFKELVFRALQPLPGNCNKAVAWRCRQVQSAPHALVKALATNQPSLRWFHTHPWCCNRYLIYFWLNKKPRMWEKPSLISARKPSRSQPRSTEHCWTAEKSTPNGFKCFISFGPHLIFNSLCNHEFITSRFCMSVLIKCVYDWWVWRSGRS